MLTMGTALSQQVDAMANLYYDCRLLLDTNRYWLFYKQATGNLSST